MDRYKLLNALDNPSYIDKIEYDQLENVIETYPYFQTGYLLLAQKIAHTTHALPESQLATIATHIGNREILYKMLHPTDVDFIEQPLSQEILNQLQQEASSNELPLLPDIVEETITQGENIDNLLNPPNLVTDNTQNSPILDQPLPAIVEQEQMVEEKSIVTKEETAEEIVQDLSSDISNTIVTTQTIVEEPFTDASVQELIDKTDEQLEQILQDAPDDIDNTTNDSLLSTGEINEKARQQVEQELLKRLNANPPTELPPPPPPVLSSDTADLSGVIQQEVRQLIKQKVEKDLAKIHEAEKNIETRELSFIQESIKEHDDLMEQLQDKMAVYKQSLPSQNIDDIDKETPAKDLTLEDHSIEANPDLMFDLQAKLAAFKAANKDTHLEAGNNDFAVDQSESSSSIDELLSDFEAYKQQKSKFSEQEPLKEEATIQQAPPVEDNTPSIEKIDSPPIRTEENAVNVGREGIALSEMMIKVYVRQGNFDKAIQTYRQLSLEYPEKSAYFAAKIQELQNKQ
ncbi:MAG: hypothetical protein JNM36_08555 [Chitinophagales bacterium]|nr:hypothetical protein [Chitinophagales bacterium]HNI44749.1 hypothetical protein [Chitinophagales bacterium]HNL06787.1 hypothetical protein [Chitinophagales bacterium]